VQSTDIAGIIEAASVGNSGKEVLIEQQYFIPRAGGYSETESLWNQRFYTEGAKIALNSTQDHFSKQYEAWLKTVWDSIPKKLLDGASIEDLTVQMTAFFNNEWARQFLAFESAAYLQKINLPFLVINGSKDVQVPAIANQAAFKANMSAQSLQKSRFSIVEGANHLFQQCQTCSLSEYATLEQSLDPILITQVRAWILEQR
jgi:pimeloyl-ACP methyl ester carboxylesterase